MKLQVRNSLGGWRPATGWSHRTIGRPRREIDLHGVRPGVYRIVVSHPHYLTAATRAFRIARSAAVKLPPIVLERGGRLQGLYVADGGWSMDHPPQARAYLRKRGAEGTWRWKLVRAERTVAIEDDMTDSFDLRGLPPGTYAVCIRVVTLGCLGGPTPRSATPLEVTSHATVKDLVVRRTTI